MGLQPAGRLRPRPSLFWRAAPPAGLCGLPGRTLGFTDNRRSLGLSSADVRDVGDYKVEGGGLSLAKGLHSARPPVPGAQRRVQRAALRVPAPREGGRDQAELGPRAGSAPGRPLGCRKRATSVRHSICQGPREAADVRVCPGSAPRTSLPSTPLLCPAVRPRQLSLRLRCPLPAVIVRLCADVLAALSARAAVFTGAPCCLGRSADGAPFRVCPGPSGPTSMALPRLTWVPWAA